VNGRKIVTGVLLGFVAVSVGWLILKETRGRTADETGAAAAPAAIVATTAAPAEVATPAPRKLVSTYFHVNKRCNTCRAIERQARESVETGFPEALMSGRLEWRAVNLDDPGNDHFYTDFQLTGSSLVLVDFVEGKVARFKALQKTWDLVADPPAFQTYVQAEVTSWLEGP
jgi:hypothetical protein